MQEPRVHRPKLGQVETRRAAMKAGEVEIGGDRIEAGPGLGGTGAEAREIARQRERFDALIAKLGQRQASQALRQSLARGVGQQGQMAEFRRRCAQGQEQLDLGAGVGHVVGAADHVADGKVDVVHDGGEGVEVAPIGADQHRIALARLIDLLRPAHQIDPTADPAREPETPMGTPAFGFQRLALRFAQRQRRPVVDRRFAALKPELALQSQLFRRLVAGIEPARDLEIGRRLVVARQARRLGCLLVPNKPQPEEIGLHPGGIGGGRALAVGVIEAQEEAAAVAMRVEPVGERDIGVADMQAAGRARREAQARR